VGLACRLAAAGLLAALTLARCSAPPPPPPVVQRAKEAVVLLDENQQRCSDLGRKMYKIWLAAPGSDAFPDYQAREIRAARMEAFATSLTLADLVKEVTGEAAAGFREEHRKGRSGRAAQPVWEVAMAIESLNKVQTALCQLVLHPGAGVGRFKTTLFDLDGNYATIRRGLRQSLPISDKERAELLAAMHEVIGDRRQPGAGPGR
jgi:hypothetical protein